MNKLFRSKKFWVSAIAVVVPLLNLGFGWDLAPEEIITVISPLLVYVLGQGMADTGKEVKSSDA